MNHLTLIFSSRVAKSNYISRKTFPVINKNSFKEVKMFLKRLRRLQNPPIHMDKLFCEFYKNVLKMLPGRSVVLKHPFNYSAVVQDHSKP